MKRIEVPVPAEKTDIINLPLTEGERVCLVITGAKPDETVHLRAYETSKKWKAHLIDATKGSNLMTRSKAPHEFELPAFTVGSYSLQPELRRGGGKTGPTINVVVTAAVVQEPGPTPDPVEPPPPAWNPYFGACCSSIDQGKTAALAAKTKQLCDVAKIGVLRVFGPSAKLYGEYDAGSQAHIDRLLAAGVPGVISCHMPPENKPKEYPVDDAAWRRYFRGANPHIVKHKGRQVVSLVNEFNLKKYWQFGGGGEFSQVAVDKVLRVCQIAREEMPDAFILAPSVGWNASTRPHKEYIKALVDGGVLNYCNAIDDHFYFRDLGMVEEVLSHHRELIGWYVDLWLTEQNWLGDPSKLKDYIALLVKYRVKGIIYRLVPLVGQEQFAPLGAFSDYDVTKPNKSILAAWGVNL